jgi:hypothetical protein
MLTIGKDLSLLDLKKSFDLVPIDVLRSYRVMILIIDFMPIDCVNENFKTQPQTETMKFHLTNENVSWSI